MEIIQQLRGSHWVDASERLRLVNLAADEIERLRKDKAQLIEALTIAADGFMDSGEEDLEDMCRAVIAKATGGK